MNNKIYKPGECMKYMNVEMHPVLLEKWYCADVTREVIHLGACVVPSPELYEPAVVLWSRCLQPELKNNTGQMKLALKEECDRAVYVQCADETATHVHDRTWSQHVSRIRDMVGRKMTVAVFGVKDHLKKKGRKTTNSHRNSMSEVELQMAITDLLVSAGCDVVTVNTPKELALLIAQFTKALAEAPYKRAKRAWDEKAEFYMRGDKNKSVAVDKNGNGVARLWQQMVAVLPNSSLEISRALCAKYRSPSEFFEALQRPNIVNELADIEVDRAGLPGAKCRRLRPEFARKLHTLFSANDGDAVVDECAVTGEWDSTSTGARATGPSPPGSPTCCWAT